MATILLGGIVILGCAAPFRSSGIDPTGNRVFIDPAQNMPVAVCPQPVCPPGTVPVCPTGTIPVCPQPITVCPPLEPCPSDQPPSAAFGNLEPYSPPSSAIIRQPETGLPTPVGSQLAAGAPPSVGPLAGAMSGGYLEHPGRMLLSDNAAVIVSPCRTIAPVGSEVVLLAGVRGQDQYLRTNERVEWSIAAGSVGEFLDYGKGLWRDLLLGDWTWPRKVSPTLAITSTSRRYLRLSRETPTPDDDVNVLRGQAWVTVSSAVEGVSMVTAFAPSVYGWQARKQTAVIHWVDAQWKLPTPAIVPAGSNATLATVVTRHTNGSPCAGWKVRYEILGGQSSGAGFGPDGAACVTVLTDQCGRAATELRQLQAASGSAQVNIRVVRPAELAGSAGKELNVGGGSTSVTWTSPELSIRKTGPDSSGVGQSVIYRIDVTNPGDLATGGVVVTDEIPSGLNYVGSTPSAELTGRTLRWNLGTLPPRGSSTIEVRHTAARSGSVTSCAEAIASDGLKARDCVTTTVGTATVEVTMLGPQNGPIYVGDEVDFNVVVANRGQATATGLSIVDRFDPGLEHAAAKSPIERDLGALEPGKSQKIGLRFRATRAGQLCHNVEVSSAGRILATGRGCANVLARATQPSSPLTPSTGQASLNVWRECPKTAKVGEEIMSQIFVKNNGDVPLTNVRVVEKYKSVLAPTQASNGYDNSVPRQMSWLLPNIQPNTTERLRIYYKCESEATRTCASVKVTSEQGANASAESCLQITPNVLQPVTPTSPQGLITPSGKGLKISVNDNHDPIMVGKKLTYTITVTNESFEPDRDLVLSVTVPPELEPRATGNFGPANLGARIVGQNIVFDKLLEIRGGESLPYHVCVDTKRAGTAVLKVSLTSRNSTFPINEQTETTVRAE